MYTMNKMYFHYDIESNQQNYILIRFQPKC